MVAAALTSTIPTHKATLSNPSPSSYSPISQSPLMKTGPRSPNRFAVSCVQDDSSVIQRPDSFGRFGEYGGKYVPETLMYALSELQSALKAIATDHQFQNSSAMHVENFIADVKDSDLAFEGIPEAIQKHEVFKGSLAKLLDVLFSKGSLMWVAVSPSVQVVYELAVKSERKTPEKISCNDLVGLEGPMADMQLTLKTLKGDRRFAEFGEKLTWGILLCGPEGTGKETLVNAIAHEANVPFYNVSAQEIARDGATKGIAKIISVFLSARMYSRCLIYIKEIDAIAGKKTTESGPFLLQLLTEMEKCSKDDRTVIVIGGTTKKPELLDPKLTNSEQFLKEVLVDKPNKEARLKFIDLYLTRFIEPNNIEEVRTLIVSETEGLVRNDIARVARLAKQNASKKDRKKVTTADVIEALKTVKSSITTPMAQEKQLVTKDGEHVSNGNNVLEALN